MLLTIVTYFLVKDAAALMVVVEEDRLIKVCTYCGRSGHTIDIYYGKHRYPPGHPYYSGRPWYHNHASSSAFVNNAATNEAYEKDDKKEEHPHESGFNITPAQYQRLTALLQQPPSSASVGSCGNSQPSHANLSQVSQNGPINFSSPGLGTSFVLCILNHISSYTHALSAHSSHIVPWIINSGAIDHIVSSLDCFQVYSKIKPVNINLPDVLWSRHITQANFVIYNVFYIPDFNFNLISISKLISTLHYTLIFSSVFCKIQEVSSLKIIGLEKLKEGLYHLVISKEEQVSSPRTSSVNTSTTTPLTTSNL